jgi:hypothetical protein
MQRKVFHLFLRFRRDSQSYDNDWADDFRLRSIKTYDKVADYCREAMHNGTRIRIHRRKFERYAAMICGECSVESVAAENNGFRVTFGNWHSLSIPYDKRMQQGYYFADPADYESEQDD